jgi:hypothetical protein
VLTLPESHPPANRPITLGVRCDARRAHIVNKVLIARKNG